MNRKINCHLTFCSRAIASNWFVLIITFLMVLALSVQASVDTDEALKFYWNPPATGIADHYNVYIYSLLFSTGLKFQDNLDNRVIPQDLRNEFENNKIILSQSATVSIEKTGSDWWITDDQNKYNIEKEINKLNIHLYINNNYKTYQTPTRDNPYLVPIKAEHLNTYKVEVAAVDKTGKEGPRSEKSDPVLCYYSTQPVIIKLKSGWNFISLPVKLPSTDLKLVLSSIEGKYKSVWTYDASGAWKWYPKNLTTIVEGKGYLINMNSAADLILNNWTIASTKIELVKGRNYVGYNSLQAQPFESALSSIKGMYRSVSTYNNPRLQELVYKPQSKPQGILTDMIPGKGYIIDSTVDKGDWDITKPGSSLSPPSRKPDPQDTSGINMLQQNYPNPFNPETWIPYQLKEDAIVAVSIYTLAGQLIRTLNLGYKKADNYLSKEDAAVWDGRNEAGEHVSSGVYFCIIKAGNFTSSRKMVVMK